MVHILVLEERPVRGWCCERRNVESRDIARKRIGHLQFKLNLTQPVEEENSWNTRFRAQHRYELKIRKNVS